MSNHTKVVDGVVVTNTDIPPPRDWTNVYDEIGGDMRWNEEVEATVKSRGLDGDIQPFYGKCSYRGEALFLMQVGGQDFFFWNALDDSMYHVNGNLSLEKIVAGLDEEGLNAFELGALRGDKFTSMTLAILLVEIRSFLPMNFKLLGKCNHNDCVIDHLDYMSPEMCSFPKAH